MRGPRPFCFRAATTGVAEFVKTWCIICARASEFSQIPLLIALLRNFYKKLAAIDLVVDIAPPRIHDWGVCQATAP